MVTQVDGAESEDKESDEDGGERIQGVPKPNLQKL